MRQLTPHPGPAERAPDRSGECRRLPTRSTDPRLRTTVLGTLETTAVRNGTFCFGRPRRAERVYQSPTRRAEVHPPGGRDKNSLPFTRAHSARKKQLSPGCALGTRRRSLLVGEPREQTITRQSVEGTRPGPRLWGSVEGTDSPA